MESGRVDAAHRIARADLPGGDIWAAIDLELKRNRQFAKVDLIPLDNHLIPRRVVDELAGLVGLAALPEGTRQIVDRYAEAGGKQLTIAGDVRHDGHGVAADILENDDRTFSGAIQLENDRGGLEAQVDRLTNPDDLIGKLDRKSVV